MKITLAQIRVYSNQIERNFLEIEEIVLKNASNSDLIIFPELVLSGYIAKKFSEVTYINELLKYNELMIKLSEQVAIIWGNIELKDGVVYSSIYFAASGKLITPFNCISYNKLDVNNSFLPLHQVSSYYIYKDKTFLLSFIDYPFNEDIKIDYKISLGNKNWIKEEVYPINQINNTFTEIYLNMVGFYNTNRNVFPFSGGSYIKSNNHTRYLNNEYLSEVETINDNNFIENDLYHPTLFESLVKTLQFFDEELFPYHPKWIIGVSGGLDSSVSLALLVAAFGKKRVVPVTLPSQFSSKATLENVNYIGDALKLNIKEINIDSLAKLSIESLEKSKYKDFPNLVVENIQARLRGHLLMAVSGVENGVIINNSNKIEIALGYSTLYGDTIGTLALLGDLSKLDIIDLATEINQISNKTIIPTNLIAKITDDSFDWEVMPSAELAKNQIDPMKYGYHDHLIIALLNGSINELLESYLAGRFFKDKRFKLGLNYGFDDPKSFIDDINYLMRSIQIANYKRIQMPPILTVSKSAFGLKDDNQLPFQLTSTTQNLIEKILNNKEEI